MPRKGEIKPALSARSEFLTFRCTPPFAAGLRRQALIERSDLSELVRRLIAQAAEAEGINLRTL